MVDWVTLTFTWGTDVQFAAHQVFQLVESQLTVLGSLQGLAGQRNEGLSGLGERHLMAVAHEQRLVEVALQLQDLLRERALGDKQFFGCRRKVQERSCD